MVKAPVVRRYGATRTDEIAMTNAKRRHLNRLQNATGASVTSRGERRFVVLDMDNILQSLRSSRVLYESIDGAASGYDLRMDIAQLTKLMRADAPRSSCLLHAVYGGPTPPDIASVFEDFGWTLRRASGPPGVSRQDAIKQLVKRGIASNDDSSMTTLVLVSGDGELVTKTASFNLWDVLDVLPSLRVEVHSWLHSLHNAFFDLARRFPNRVQVYALNDSIVTLVATADGLMSAYKRQSTGIFAIPDASNHHRHAFDSFQFNPAGCGVAARAIGSKPTKDLLLKTASSQAAIPALKNSDPALVVPMVLVAIAVLAITVWFYGVVFPFLAAVDD